MSRSAIVPLARIAWRNVRKHWRHSLGALLSIVVGFVSIGLFEGYLADLEAIQGEWYIERSMLGHVIVERRGAFEAEGREEPFRYALDTSDQAFLDAFLAERAGEVAARARVLIVSGLASTGRAAVVFAGWGYDVEDAARLRGGWAWNTSGGRPLHEAGPESVITGNGLGSLLDCTPPPAEDALGPDGRPRAEVRAFTCQAPRVQLTATTETGQLNAIDPEIVGFFDAGLKELDGRFLHLPLPLAQRLLDTERVTYYAVRLRDSSGADAFARAIAEAAAARGLDLVAVPWHAHQMADLYRKGMTVLGLYRTFVVIIVVTIAGMAVLTTMLKAVNERIREIGTLRSLGFRRRHVVWLFTLEAGLLAAVASIAGLVVTFAVSRFVAVAGISYKAGLAAQAIPFTVSLVPSALLFALVFLSAVAVLAAFLPSRRAARTRIPDALGHAG